MNRQPYFAPHNNKGTRSMHKPNGIPTAPVPAQVNIQQMANGTFQIRHNIPSRPMVIGILSLMINTLAGEIAQGESMIIDPTRPTNLVPEDPSKERIQTTRMPPIPEPETNKVS